MKLLASLALLAIPAMAEVDPIIIKGSKFFFKSNETQFFIKGIAYQQDASSVAAIMGSNKYKDPLADAAACRRDVPLLQELHTNTIRVYAIDPKADHAECMKLLSDAGIYVIADLSEPDESINRNQPVWNNALYDRYTSVLDAMAQYPNLLGFFAGNEVSNSKENTDASAFVKAAVRDMKRYIKARNYRQMGVGYATNDDADIRNNMAKYFNCRSEDESIDFWGYNIYSWCGDSSYQASGFKERTEEFGNYSVPIFFAEYGCNRVQPRKFTEVETLFGTPMSDTWSGGIVYMYFQEDNNYGLVSAQGSSVRKLPDFTYYSEQIANVHPTGVKKNAYTPTNTAPQSCPPVNTEWRAAASPLPPSPNSQLCSCMESKLECIVKDDVPPKEYGDLFETVCAYGVCSGISSNATDTEYGAYSVCNAKQQLSYVLDLYYQEQKKRGNEDSACDFGGAATTKQVEKISKTCKDLLDQAGAVGTGTVEPPSPTPGAPTQGDALKPTPSADRSAHAHVNFGFAHFLYAMALAVFPQFIF